MTFPPAVRFSRATARFLALSAVSIVLMYACRKKADPLIRANYYLQNKTTFTLRIDAVQGNAPVPLLKDTVRADATEKFFTATAGESGSVFPAAFFSGLQIFALTANGDSLVYAGVKNSDWKEENNENSTVELVLTVE